MPLEYELKKIIKNPITNRSKALLCCCPKDPATLHDPYDRFIQGLFVKCDMLYIIKSTFIRKPFPMSLPISDC